MWQGQLARFKGPGWKCDDLADGSAVGAMRMLDLAAPAAAIGYGVGRIGCLLAGDGDYGINTTLPWGVHMAKNALVPHCRMRWCSRRRSMSFCFRWRFLAALAAGQEVEAGGLADRGLSGAVRGWALSGGVRAHQSSDLLGYE